MIGRRAASIGAVAAITFSVIAAIAAAAPIGGRDHGRGARFALSGRVLTVTLTRTSSVRGFAGQRVRAECGSQRRLGAGTARSVRWPAGSRTLKVRFRAGAGPAPVFCSVDTASLTARSYHAEAVLK